jgi:hypothetical protein
VVSFTPGSLYHQGNSLWYPLGRRLGGPQSCSGCGGEEKNSQPHWESNPRTPIVQPVAQRYTIELSQLLVVESLWNVFIVLFLPYHNLNYM